MGSTKRLILAVACCVTAYAIESVSPGSLARAADAQTVDQDLTPAPPTDARMVIVKNKDISGEVFKRLGLPNQDYCWQQCLQEQRCTATRWGFITGATAGQCILLSGELTFGEPRDIETDDGQKIEVIASKKETKTAPD